MNIYVPHAQDASASMLLVTRTTADVSVLAGQIRQAVWSVDPNQPIDRIQTMERAQFLNSASDFSLVTLFIAFAVFALFMAAIGIYGMAWLIAGGLCYTVGAAFSAAKKMVFHHVIWHFFVLAGATCNFLAVVWYVLPV